MNNIRLSVPWWNIFVRFLNWIDKLRGNWAVAYVFGRSPIYFTPSQVWKVVEFDDYDMLMKILEHETIHGVLFELREYDANSMFDNVFRQGVPLRIIPGDIFQ